nr:MAG TPA_asm: hypothetical protein [Caudoviricetes sp.]
MIPTPHRPFARAAAPARPAQVGASSNIRVACFKVQSVNRTPLFIKQDLSGGVHATEI